MLQRQGVRCQQGLQLIPKRHGTRPIRPVLPGIHAITQRTQRRWQRLGTQVVKIGTGQILSLRTRNTQGDQPHMGQRLALFIWFVQPG
ncbi:hypothetical protein D3C72_1752450 [compost metagenome]